MAYFGYSHIPYAFAVEVEPQGKQMDGSATTFVHDPYSFAAYITLANEPQLRCVRRLSLESDGSEELSTSDCSALSCISPTASASASGFTETSSEDGNEEDTQSPTIAPAGCGRRRRVRFVRGPCGHKHSKRLRFKGGHGQYICLECNLKWRSTGEEEQE